MKKILLIILLLIISLPAISLANFSASWQATSTTQGWIFPSKINGVFPTIQISNLFATSTATSTFAGSVGVGTSTPVATVDVNGGLYSEMASSTLFTYDFCTSSNNITYNATSTSALVKFTNANNCTGKSVIFNVVAPVSGNIGSTTFSGGSGSGSIVWDGAISPGNSVINSTTDRFVFTSSATSTYYIQADLSGTF